MYEGQKTVFISCFNYIDILAVVWKDAFAMYSCFEACSVKKCILQRSGEGNQLTENNGNQGEAKEVGRLKYGQKRLPELAWKFVWLEIDITVV